MPSRLGAVAERVLENARVYDLVQRAAGVKTVNRRLRRILEQIPERSPAMLDVGGGTGSAVELVPGARLYCCLEPDAAKITGFRRRLPSGVGVQADGSRLPFPSGSFDLVLCRAVSHHLTLETLDDLLAEAARVLVADGRLLFIDGLNVPRVRSRLLWMIDRGSYPRTWEDLSAAISRHFEIVASDRFAVQHEYGVALGQPRTRAAA